MAIKLRTIRNVTGVMQVIIIGNKQHSLEPGEERIVASNIADAFLKQCGQQILEIEDAEIGGVAKTEVNDTDIWLANFTGNPDVEPMVLGTEYYDKKERARKRPMVQNPFAMPRSLVEQYDQGQIEYQASDGVLEGKNLPYVAIEIPPYKRVKLPATQARWFLGMGSFREEHERGLVRRSRAPSAFEPDSTWELDDMRCYLYMMDPKAELGEPEAAIKTEMGVAEARAICLKRLFFRLADPQYRVYSLKEFSDFRTGFEPPKMSVAPTQAVGAVQELKRKRGRPRKIQPTV